MIKIILREYIKFIITNFLQFYSKGKNKDILLLSSPRSGSTWLMEIISSEDNLKYVNEPLDKTTLDFWKILPIKTRWIYTSLSSQESNVLKDYFNREKKSRIFSQKNLFDSNYNFFNNRRVIKLIRGNSLVEFFDKEFDFHIVYIIRHPISQSLSCIQRGHKSRLYEFIEDQHFVKKYLSEKQLSNVININNEGRQLEKFVAEWCLDNLIILAYLREHKNKIIFVSYEELVLNAEGIISVLTEKLNMKSLNKVLQRINKPSKVTNSSSPSTIIDIKKGNRAQLINKWKKTITITEEKKLFQILKQFNIDIYKQNCEFINKDYFTGKISNCK